MAMSVGIALAGCVWASPVERMASTWLSVPQERLLEAQLILSLGILGLASFAAFIVMVLAYKKLQRSHAAELTALERKKVAPASAQGAAFVTRRTRAELLRDVGIDP